LLLAQLETEGVVMTVTTEQVQVPEITRPAPSPRTASPSRVVLRWAPAVVALGASGLLAVAVLTPDRSPARVDTSRTVAEHGSITAIDHRDELTLLRQQSPSRTVAERGSVAAIDHRDGVTLRGPGAPSRTVAEYGSVAAIEHRDKLALLREAASRTVAEHGSVAAIEHRDEPAGR
jgi:hypothetical protein